MSSPGQDEGSGGGIGLGGQVEPLDGGQDAVHPIPNAAGVEVIARDAAHQRRRPYPFAFFALPVRKLQDRGFFFLRFGGGRRGPRQR